MTRKLCLGCRRRALTGKAARSDYCVLCERSSKERASGEAMSEETETSETKPLASCKPGTQFGICEHHTTLKEHGLGGTEGFVLLLLQSDGGEMSPAVVIHTGQVVEVPLHFMVRDVEPIDMARIMREAFGSCLIELVCPSCGGRFIHYDFAGPNTVCSNCKAHGSVGSFHVAAVKHGVANHLELCVKFGGATAHAEVLMEVAVALRVPDRFGEAFRPLYGKSTDVGRPSRAANLEGADPA